MGILDLLSLFHCFFQMGNILPHHNCLQYKPLQHLSASSEITGRICTQISDHTYCAAALDIHAFIQLLCQTHGLLCRKIQCLCSLLLQSTGSKRKRRILGTFSISLPRKSHTSAPPELFSTWSISCSDSWISIRLSVP